MNLTDEHLTIPDPAHPEDPYALARLDSRGIIHLTIHTPGIGNAPAHRDIARPLVSFTYLAVLAQVDTRLHAYLPKISEDKHLYEIPPTVISDAGECGEGATELAQLLAAEDPWLYPEANLIDHALIATARHYSVLHACPPCSIQDPVRVYVVAAQTHDRPFAALYHTELGTIHFLSLYDLASLLAQVHEIDCFQAAKTMPKPGE